MIIKKIQFIFTVVSNKLIQFDREERCYMSGRLDGPAKYFYKSGAVETRIYENGVLQGNFTQLYFDFILKELHFLWFVKVKL